MKKIINFTFVILLSLSICENALAESKLDKVKNKIKAGEQKLIGKIWGSKDCSHISTKTFSGLTEYKRCKSGLEPSDKSFFESLKFKQKKSNTYDPNKPCDEYSTKTFTGLAAKMKCKRAKKK